MRMQSIFKEKWHVSFETCGRQVKKYVKVKLVQRPSYNPKDFPAGRETRKNLNFYF